VSAFSGMWSGSWLRVGLRTGILSLLALLIPGSTSPLKAQTQHSELDLKAAIIAKFGLYVEWPESTLGGGESGNFILCTLGDQQLFEALQTAAQAQTLQGRPVQVSGYSDREGIDVCDILFVSETKESELEDVLSVSRGAGVLTVSEIPGFAESGGMIRLFMEDQYFRFEINPEAAEDEGLRLSAGLLNLARIVREGGPSLRNHRRELREDGP